MSEREVREGSDSSIPLSWGPSPFLRPREYDWDLWVWLWGLGTALPSRVKEAALLLPPGDSPVNAPHRVPRLLSRTAGKLAEGSKRDSPTLSKAEHHPVPGYVTGWLAAAPGSQR